MLNNGYNNWLGTACLGGVSVCVRVFAIEHVRLWISEWLWVKLACIQTDVSFITCRSLPAGTAYARCNIFVCVHLGIDCLPVINNPPITFSLITPTFLMREEETRGNCTNKSGKAWVIFCDAFPTKPPTVSRTPWQLFCFWLMTSRIVGPRAYDLLIKFVFTRGELVGLAALWECCSISSVLLLCEAWHIHIFSFDGVLMASWAHLFSSIGCAVTYWFFIFYFFAKISKPLD